MVVNTFRCNECPKHRDPEVNHWRLGIVREAEVVFRDWDDEIAAQEGVLHLCSDDCSVLAFRGYLNRHKERQT